MQSGIKAASAKGRLNIFFLEMIIVLLFFGIASAVIVGAFAASDRISRESGRLEKMSFCAQSAAEIFSETGSISETAETLFGIDTGSDQEAVVPLDENCKYSGAEGTIYMKMRLDGSSYGNGLAKLEISFSDKSGKHLYTVTAAAYLPDGAKDGDNSGK